MESYQVLEWGQSLQRVRQPTPEPADSEVLVRVSACGVCHSDVHIRNGFYDMGEGRSLQSGGIDIHLPLTMGHEIVGEVVAVGPRTHVKWGMKVRRIPWIGRGECRYCKSGAELDCEKPRSLGTVRGRHLPVRSAAAHANSEVDGVLYRILGRVHRTCWPCLAASRSGRCHSLHAPCRRSTRSSRTYDTVGWPDVSWGWHEASTHAMSAYQQETRS